MERNELERKMRRGLWYCFVWLLKRAISFPMGIKVSGAAALSLTAPPPLTPFISVVHKVPAALYLSGSSTLFHRLWEWDEGSSGWELRDQLADSPFSGLYNHSPCFSDLSWQVKSLLVEVEIWQLKSWCATSHANVSIWEMELSRGIWPWVIWLMLFDWSPIPPFLCFSPLSFPRALCHSFILILGARGRSCQPPACPGLTEPHWRADNRAAVFPWRISAWGEARRPWSSLESCPPPGLGETAQVVHSGKHKGCYIWSFILHVTYSYLSRTFHLSPVNTLQIPAQNCTVLFVYLWF